MNDLKKRNELILNYLPLANKLAWEKKKQTPDSISFEELQSAAYSGLVSAADRFESNKNVSFSWYARIRIYGQMKDYLRSLRWTKVCEIVSYDTADEPYIDADEINDFFTEATNFLNAIGKKVVIMYYKDDLSLKEIGHRLNLSESRICQILKKSLGQIKQKYFEQAA